MEDRKEWKTGEKSDIEIRNLSVSFQDGGETVHAMEGVNAYFPAGSVTGLIGESGSADIITLVDYMIEQGPESVKFTVSELCSRFSPNNSKSMEQRIRRAVNAGLTNLANMGLEDYSNDTFHDLAGTLYSFEQIRKEMDYIRGKSGTHGKVSLKNFLNSLIFYCTN
mgnify:CR=1 FL=1